MITENDLKEAIAECEGQRNPSANTCVKLAAFYTLKDKMFPSYQEEKAIAPHYSYSASPPVRSDAQSEFMRAITNVSPEEIIPIMDELMSAIKVIVPKLYDGVMRKLP